MRGGRGKDDEDEYGGSGASRSDSSDVEGERVTTEVKAALACLGAAPNGGEIDGNGDVAAVVRAGR